MKLRNKSACPTSKQDAREKSDTSTLPAEPASVNSSESSANSAPTPRRGERRVDKRFLGYPNEFLRWNTVYDYSPEFVAAEYNGHVRHWLNPLGFRFYAYQCPSDGRWRILDRGWDVAVTKPYRSRTKAIRAFNRRCKEWLQLLGVKSA